MVRVEQVVCRQLGSRQEARLLGKAKHHVGVLAQALVWNVVRCHIYFQINKYEIHFYFLRAFLLFLSKIKV